MSGRWNKLRKSGGITLVCGALGLGGCSTAQPPTAIVSQAELAVQQAGQSKAPEYASRELSLARQKFDNAKRAMDADRYEEARQLAEQALVDAQLAEMRAEAESAKQAAQELRKAIESLRTEAERAALHRGMPRA
ncbi:MAG: DUF4398 domain-containing protein [Candidatus Binatia bacterium]